MRFFKRLPAVAKRFAALTNWFASLTKWLPAVAGGGCVGGLGGVEVVWRLSWSFMACQHDD
jgi:hypothetical protein